MHYGRDERRDVAENSGNSGAIAYGGVGHAAEEYDGALNQGAVVTGIAYAVEGWGDDDVVENVEGRELMQELRGC